MSSSSRVKNVTEKKAAGRRPVRSFVLRGGRLTEGQKRAMDEFWPRFGIDEDESLLVFKTLFGNDAPVIMEIGFGNGDAIWQMAQARPAENYVGVEVHQPGVGHLLLKLKQHGIANIRFEPLSSCHQSTLPARIIRTPETWKRSSRWRQLPVYRIQWRNGSRICPRPAVYVNRIFEGIYDHS
ncbi:MAG: hypothetical protein IIC63_08855, partial [Proteobacteria bacterium]|nr:hypothetical protein [Pseudomonadota bacterium]